MATPEQPRSAGSFGQNLKRERQRRGVGVEDLAQATKITRRHLIALECNDLAGLPGGAFNRGYVRAYARYLGLDEEAVLHEYTAEERRLGLRAPTDKEITREISRALSKGGERARIPASARILAVVVLLAALAIAGWHFLGRPGSDIPLLSAAAPPVHAAGTVEAASPANDEHGASGSPPLRDAATTAAPASLRTEQPEAPTPDPAVSPPATEEPAAPRPVPPQQPTPLPGTPAPSQLMVSDYGTGTDVRDHQLLGRATTFPEGTAVVFWTRALDGRDGDIIRHLWSHEGQTMSTLDLRIGGPHWRNHSRTTLSATGPWSVEARDAAGRLLARHEFTCTPAVGG